MSNKFEPYYRLEDFVIDPNRSQMMSEYICDLCKGVFHHTTTDDCGHFYCKECILKSLETSNICPLNPSNIIKSENLKHVPFIDSIINKQQIYCKNRGRVCTWVGEVIELSKHLNLECLKESIKCPFKQCTAYMLREDLPTHEADCAYKEEDCPTGCGMKLTKAQFTYHSEQCPKLPIHCPQFCGEMIERNEEQNHLKICKYTMAECNFKFMGCDFTIPQGQLIDHQMEQYVKHLNLVAEYLKNKGESSLPNDRSTKFDSDSHKINKINKPVVEPQKMLNKKRSRGRPGRPPKGRPGRPRKNKVMEEEIEDLEEESENNNIRSKVPPKKSMQKEDSDDENEVENQDDDVESRSESEYRFKSGRKNGKQNHKETANGKGSGDSMMDVDFSGLVGEALSSTHSERNKEVEITKTKKEVFSVQHPNTDIPPQVAPKRRGRPPKKNQLGQQQIPKMFMNSKTNNKPVSDDEESRSLSQTPSKLRKHISSRRNPPPSVTIDMNNLPGNVDIEDNQTTAILKEPVKNTHRFIFGNVDVKGIDYNWGIKINEATDKSWIAIGLCMKDSILEKGGKFLKATPSSYLLTSNGYSFNCSNSDQNDKQVSSERFKSGATINIKYNHKDKALVFTNGTDLVKLTNVWAAEGELVPCVVLMNVLGDSISFI
jgi:hypothetical protein